MMAIYLEEAAQVLYGALQIGTPIPLTLDESKKRQVEAFRRWTWSGRGTFSRTWLRATSEVTLKFVTSSIVTDELS